MNNIRNKLSYANVMASVAVFAALGGGAFAATQKAAKDSVVSSSIKNGKVKSSDIRDSGVGTGDIADGAISAADLAGDSVNGAKIADGEVTGAELAEGSVASPDIVDDGVTGADVDEASLGTVPDADLLDGRDSEDFYRYGGWVPPGKTISGVWGGREYGANNPLVHEISFPMPARLVLEDNDVNFDAGGNAGSIGTDDDATCTGSTITPTAPPGKVCIYVHGADLLAGNGTAEGLAGASGRRGFEIRGPSNPVGDVEIHGAWAYTGE